MNHEIDSGELELAVSALVDGELDVARSGRLAQRVAGDPALARRWARYHLIGEVMRGNRQIVCDDRLCERVHAEIRDEPLALRTRRGPRWVPIAGLGLAATLAGVALLVSGGAHERAPQRLAVAVPAAPTAAASTAGGPRVRPVARAAEIRLVGANRAGGRDEVALRWNDARGGPAATRLNAYLINHSEYLGGDLRGVMPYARIISYQPAP